MAGGQIQPDAETVLFNCATGLKYPMPDRAGMVSRAGPIDYARFIPS